MPSCTPFLKNNATTCSVRARDVHRGPRDRSSREPLDLVDDRDSVRRPAQVNDGEEDELFELAEALVCHRAERIQRQHLADKAARGGGTGATRRPPRRVHEGVD